MINIKTDYYIYIYFKDQININISRAIQINFTNVKIGYPGRSNTLPDTRVLVQALVANI